MKRISNPGHPNGKQAEIPKARYVCYSSDEGKCHEAFHLNPIQAKANITVTIESTPVQVWIDAKVKTIDYATYEEISAAKTVPLTPTNAKLRPYGEDKPCPDSFRRIVFRNDQYSVRADGPDQVTGTQSTKCWLSPKW